MRKTVNKSTARSDSYLKVLERIERDKVCPFCEKHFLTYHTRPIIRKSKHWILTENFKPYEGARHHLLAVSRKHVQHFEKLSAEAQAELFSLFAREVRKRKIPGGTLFMRFGNTDYTGGSVEHLHAQLLSGGKRREGASPVTTTIGYARAMRPSPRRSRRRRS